VDMSRWVGADNPWRREEDVAEAPDSGDVALGGY